MLFMSTEFGIKDVASGSQYFCDGFQIGNFHSGCSMILFNTPIIPLLTLNFSQCHIDISKLECCNVWKNGTSYKTIYHQDFEIGAISKNEHLLIVYIDKTLSIDKRWLIIFGEEISMFHGGNKYIAIEDNWVMQ